MGMRLHLHRFLRWLLFLWIKVETYPQSNPPHDLDPGSRTLYVLADRGLSDLLVLTQITHRLGLPSPFQRIPLSGGQETVQDSAPPPIISQTAQFPLEQSLAPPLAGWPTAVSVPPVLQYRSTISSGWLRSNMMSSGFDQGFLSILNPPEGFLRLGTCCISDLFDRIIISRNGIKSIRYYTELYAVHRLLRIF